MAYYSSEVLFNELQEIKKLINKILQKETDSTVEEISLDKARKLLHCNSSRVIKLIKQKKLTARIQDGRYKIRIADLKKFQDENSLESIEERNEIVTESTDDLIEKLTGHRPKHRSKRT